MQFLRFWNFNWKAFSGSKRDPWDFRDSAVLRFHNQKAFSYPRGILQFCGFNRKAFFNFRRDLWDFCNFCDFAIFNWEAFYSKRDLRDFKDFCNFAISIGKRFLIQERGLRFWRFLIQQRTRFLNKSAHIQWLFLEFCAETPFNQKARFLGGSTHIQWLFLGFYLGTWFD